MNYLFSVPLKHMQFMPVRPKKHQGVYVEGVRDCDVWDLLEEKTPFSSSVHYVSYHTYLSFELVLISLFCYS